MKYFTRELVAAMDAWIEQTDQQRQETDEHFERVVGEYRRAVDALKPRLSKSAWTFFRYGFAETGLHDAQLLSFNIGDGLNYTPDGTKPLRLNRTRGVARIEFLDYEQVYRHVFEMRGLKRAGMNLSVDEDRGTLEGIGDLNKYEVTAAGEDYLRLGFLFATGSEIEIEFRRLIYKRHRIRRQYNMYDVYA